jgi:putative copper export protein/methionine-rich copper-binding protein CopC
VTIAIVAKRVPTHRCRALAALLGLAIATILITTPDAAAHAEIDHADPPVDGLLAAPPKRIELWLTEAVDTGAGSPSIRLFDDTGRTVPIGEARLDPADPRHVLATVRNLDTGTFTVGWAVRSQEDGHALSGTYAFRVGGGRAPGAARVQGETPAPWAVATRWLTFLGLAAVAGGAFFAWFILGAGAERAKGAERRRTLLTAGSAVALVATLAEPLLQDQWPRAGIVSSGLRHSVAAMPDAWWIRLAAVVLIPAILAVVATQGARIGSWRQTATGTLLVVGLLGLLGLSLTSHAAAREHWRPLGIASVVLHEWSIALWVGGLAHLAIAWPRRTGDRSDDAEMATAATPDPVRRFSRIALALVIVGVATGIVNSGLILPRLSSLWDSAYGRILLLKLLALSPVLALATFHRGALRQGAARLGSATLGVRTIRVEAMLALIVILGGSVLTLLAPPGTRAGNGDLAMVDLAAPLPHGEVHLQLQPARPGKNAVVIRLIAGEESGEKMPAGQATRIAFTPLDHVAEGRDVVPRADAIGDFAVGGVELPGSGWWRAEVTVQPVTGPATIVPFYFMLPDPNVNGIGAPPGGATDAGARAIFDRGLATMTTNHRLRFSQRLTDGQGALFSGEVALNDGTDGSPAAWSEQASSFQRIIIGDREWLREPGQPWIERLGSPLFLPVNWGESYLTARDFRLGSEVEIDGSRVRVISFMTPEQSEPRTYVAAWYTWWVDVTSGQVVREAMVSNRHYMIYQYGDFNAPIVIDPPPDAGGNATPAAGE